MWECNYKVVQPKKSGDRTNWITVGMAFKRENGFSMKLETYPMPNKDGEVWLQLYEKESNNAIQEENEKQEEQKSLYENSYGGTAK